MDDVVVPIDNYRGRRESLQKSKMQLSPGTRTGGKGRRGERPRLGGGDKVVFNDATDWNVVSRRKGEAERSGTLRK